jgi:hypothetical protein
MATFTVIYIANSSGASVVREQILEADDECDAVDKTFREDYYCEKVLTVEEV